MSTSDPNSSSSIGETDSILSSPLVCEIRRRLIVILVFVKSPVRLGVTGSKA
jgi:hypothetical protein